MIDFIAVTTLLVLASNAGADTVHVNQWAVHVEGGVEVAEQVAAEHGFVNLGKIGSIKDHYFFKKDCGESDPECEKKHRTRRDEHTSTLQGHPAVRNADQQTLLSRRRRNVVMVGGDALQPHVVSHVEQHQNRSRRLAISDPNYNQQWHLHQSNGNDINVVPVWDAGYTGKGVVVTIVDDGMEHDHPDLEANYDPSASTDLNGHDDDPYPNVNDPINKHGTRCSGEVGAVKNDVCGIGIAYKSSIGAVRMLDGDVTDAVEAGSLSLAPQHIDIYTNSWGPNDDGRTIEGPASLARKAFADGIAKGRGGKGSIYIFASGNGGTSDNCNGDGYANAVYTIAISAVDEYGNKPYYSEPCAAALAVTYSSGRGRSISTTDLHHGCTSSHSGTSAAAPIAAGILALVLEARPELTWRDIQHLVVHTSLKSAASPTDAGWFKNAAGHYHSLAFGFGGMDAKALVDLALTWPLVGQQIIYHSPVNNVADSFNGKTSTSTISVTAADGIEYLEHVQVKVYITSQKRGAVIIDFTCPSGTPSQLLDARRDTKTSAIDWILMTVRCWGESPLGTYELKVKSTSASTSNIVKNWQVILLGTKEKSGVAGQAPITEAPRTLPAVATTKTKEMTTEPAAVVVTPDDDDDDDDDDKTPEGYAVDSTGGDPACAPGHYCTEDGKSYACRAGTMQAIEGAYSPSQCLLCESGKFSLEAATECTPVHSGYVALKEGNLYVNQVRCTVGHYCEGGETGEKPCPKNFMQPESGKKSCQPCPTGEYQAKTGQPWCKQTDSHGPAGASKEGASNATRNSIIGAIGGIIFTIALVIVVVLVARACRTGAGGGTFGQATDYSGLDNAEDFEDEYDVSTLSKIDDFDADDSDEEESVYIASVKKMKAAAEGTPTKFAQPSITENLIGDVGVETATV